MTFEHKQFPEREFETSFGTGRLWATSAEHVGISFGYPQRAIGGPRYGATVETKGAVINGVEYHLRVDLTYGPRAEGEVGWGLERYDAARGSRKDGKGDLTWSARDKVKDILIPEVVEFLGTEDGLALIREADAVHWNNEVISRQAKAREAREAAEEAEVAYMTALEKLAEADLAVGSVWTGATT